MGNTSLFGLIIKHKGALMLTTQNNNYTVLKSLLGKDIDCEELVFSQLDTLIQTKQVQKDVKSKELVLTYDTDTHIAFHSKGEIEVATLKLIHSSTLIRVALREYLVTDADFEERNNIKLYVEECINEEFGGLFENIVAALNKDAHKYYNSLCEFVYEVLLQEVKKQNIHVDFMNYEKHIQTLMSKD